MLSVASPLAATLPTLVGPLPTLVGLGQTFAQYKCNTSICYGTDGGSTHALFKEFQFQLNRAGKALSSGWKSISVDGFIGSGTTGAYNALVTVTAAAGGIYERLPFATSFVDLASKIRNTDLLVDVKSVADQVAGGESQATIESRTTSWAKEGSTTTPTTPVRADGTPVTISRRPGLGMAVGVAAALAAVGLVGVAVLQKRKRRR